MKDEVIHDWVAAITEADILLRWADKLLPSLQNHEDGKMHSWRIEYPTLTASCSKGI